TVAERLKAGAARPRQAGIEESDLLPRLAVSRYRPYLACRCGAQKLDRIAAFHGKTRDCCSAHCVRAGFVPEFRSRPPWGQTTMPLISETPLFTLTSPLGGIQMLGNTPYGERRIINILGGTVEGPRLNGKVLPGGADWQVVRTDGVVHLHA